MVKTALKITALFLLLLVVIGLALPDRLVITRSKEFRAKPAEIHAELEALTTWPEWSAWNATADPTVAFRFAGPKRGVGATWWWKGHTFEEGTLKIIQSDPSAGVDYEVAMASGLNFRGRIALIKNAHGTQVTWTDEASLGMGPVGGWMALVMGGAIDESVGTNQLTSLDGLQRRVDGDGSGSSRSPDDTSEAEPRNLTESLRGHCIEWTFEDGPMAGKSFIHELHDDGTLVWRSTDEPSLSGHAGDYSTAQIGADAHVISYQGDSGHTLTVALSVPTGTLVGFGSSAEEWSAMTGRFVVLGELTNAGVCQPQQVARSIGQS